jgi:hypothetical protein
LARAAPGRTARALASVGLAAEPFLIARKDALGRATTAAGAARTMLHGDIVSILVKAGVNVSERKVGRAAE